jgi:hypothetical protein
LENQTTPGWRNRLQLLVVGGRDRAFKEDVDDRFSRKRIMILGDSAIALSTILLLLLLWAGNLQIWTFIWQLWSVAFSAIFKDWLTRQLSR